MEMLKITEDKVLVSEVMAPVQCELEQTHNVALREIQVIERDRAMLFSATGNDQAQLRSMWSRAVVKYRSEGADLDEANAKRCQGVNNATATLRKPNCVQPSGAEVGNTQT